MRAATRALLDQADAAGREAGQVMRVFAELTESKVKYVAPGAVTRGVLAKLHARGRSGRLGLCSHLSYAAPAVALWMPWSPGKLHCPPCADVAARRIRGTPSGWRGGGGSRKPIGAGGTGVPRHLTS